MRLIAAALIALFAAAASGAEPGFHERVTAVYSFSPHLLAKPALDAKSVELDGFWNSVKARGPSGLEDLRKELERPDASPFFSYDGAKLLVLLSKTGEDRALALRAISRTDLRDVQQDDYFWTIHQFAVDGYDTSDAAFKILGDPGYQVIVAQHAMTLDQEMCLVYLLLPTKEEFYLDKAEKRLFAEKDATAQQSLLGLIADTATKSGDETLARFAASTDQPAESRKYANTIIAATRQMASARAAASKLSYDELKTEQRKLFARVSDEALDDWEPLRVQLRRKGP